MTSRRDERAVYRYVAWGTLLGVLIIAALFLVACAPSSGQDDVPIPSYGGSAPTAAIPEPPPLADYVGPGAFRIGTEMTPGVWLTPGAATALCSYWIRGDGGTVIEQDSTPRGEALLVQLDRDDEEQQVFESDGCEPWREVSP